MTKQKYRSTSLLKIYDSVRDFEVKLGFGQANAGRRKKAGFILYRTSYPNREIFRTRLAAIFGDTLSELTHLSRAGNKHYSDAALDEGLIAVIGQSGYDNIRAYFKKYNPQAYKTNGQATHFAVQQACRTASENAVNKFGQ